MPTRNDSRNIPHFVERGHTSKSTESIEQYYAFFDRLQVRSEARKRFYKELLSFRNVPEKWNYLRRGTSSAWRFLIQYFLVKCRTHILNKDGTFEDEIEKEWAEDFAAVCDTFVPILEDMFMHMHPLKFRPMIMDEDGNAFPEPETAAQAEAGKASKQSGTRQDKKGNKRTMVGLNELKSLQVDSQDAESSGEIRTSRKRKRHSVSVTPVEDLDSHQQRQNREQSRTEHEQNHDVMSTVLKRLDALESHVQLLSRMRTMEPNMPAPGASATPPSTLGQTSQGEQAVGHRSATQNEAFDHRHARTREPEEPSTDDLMEGSGGVDSDNGDGIEVRLAGRDLGLHVMSLYKHMHDSDPLAEKVFKDLLKDHLSTPAIKAAARRLAKEASYLSDSNEETGDV